MLIDVSEKVLVPNDSYDDEPDAQGTMVYRTRYGWFNADDLDVSTYEPNLVQAAVGVIQEAAPGDVQIDWHSDGVTWEVGVPVPETTAAEFVQKCLAAISMTMWQDHRGTIVINNPLDVVSAHNYAISKDASYAHPEVELTKPLKTLSVVHHYTHHSTTKTSSFEINPDGDIITVDIPYVYDDDSHIEYLKDQYAKWWNKREVVSGEFRADPRLELFDRVEVETKYGTLSPVMITYLKYTYNGAFRAVYEGKVTDESFNAK
jgi:hypothetical protein